jgi:DNA polymerase III subunit delta
MIYLYHGKDSFLSYRNAKSQLLETLEKKPHLEKLIIDADSVELDHLVADIFTQNMFGGDKAILIKRFTQNKAYKDKQDALLEMISSHKESETHLIFWEESKIASNTKYFKVFDSEKKAFGSDELNKRSFATWAKAEVKNSEIKIVPDALEALMEFSNHETERFASELSKYKLSNKSEITIADVIDGSTNTIESTIWHLIDVINGVKPGKAIAVIDELLGQHEAPHFMLAMIIRNTRLLIMTHELLSKGEDSKTIASTLKIPPFTVYAIIKSAQKTDKAKLKALYRMLYNLDFEIKIGNIEPELGLTLLATRL